MSAAILTAIAALVAHVVAAAAPRRPLSAVAAVLTVVAIALRTAGVGAGFLGLAVAAGLALAAMSSRPRALHAIAATFCLPAAVFASAAPPASIMWVATSALAAALVAFVVAAVAIDCVAGSPRVRGVVAALLAFAPSPALIARPLAGSAELPLGVEPLAWLQRGHLQLDASLAADWSIALWQALPWFGLVAVAVAWTAADRRIGIAAWSAWCAVAAIAAFGQAEAVQAWLSGGHDALVAGASDFPVAARGAGAARMVDGSAALLVVARQLAVLALLFGPVSESTASDNSVWLDVGACAMAASLLGAWAVLAPAWLGAHWLADPAAGAAMAALVATLGVMAWRHEASASWLRAAQLGAAALLLGGADLGWRVASGLLAG